MNTCGPDEGQSPLSVLVVDDNEVNRLYLLHTLRKMGHIPTTAGDGREAVALFARQAFDLVLMDVQLPDMDGLTLTRIIRDGQGGMATSATVPIVALTAFATAEDRRRCLDAGMNEHLAKPVRPQDIQAALERVRTGACGDSDNGGDKSTPFDLSEFTQSSEREFATEMLSLFLELAESKRQSLSRAVARGDIAGAAALAHDLAGMAGPIRAKRLHQTMKAVQEACNNGELDACLNSHATADRELATVLDAVRTHPYLADGVS